MSKYLIRPDILRWIPGKWEHFAGNYRIIRHFKKLLKKLRGMTRGVKVIDHNRLCFLLTGKSRTGKTALVKFLARCVVCKQLDPETLNPCDGTCPTCAERPEQCGLSGLNAVIHAYGVDGRETIPVHFVVVDCTLIRSPDELRDLLATTSSGFEGIRIFYFDEVHRLISRGMDEMLLKAVEEKQAVWFFSTAKPQGLEDMFKNRLIKLTTEHPAEGELAVLLSDLCTDWGIPYDDMAILRVVQKSNRVVGTALHALAMASLDDEEGLSVNLVENDWQPKLE